MQYSIRKKTQNIHNQFRKAQIDNYRNQVREQLLSNTIGQAASQALNKESIRLVQTGDLGALYSLLYVRKNHQKDEVPIASLFLDNLPILLNFLLSNTREIKSLLLLRSLFDLHYLAIFTNPGTQDQAKAIVKVLYEETNNLVRAYGQSGKSSEYQTTINGLLQCIQCLAYNHHEHNPEGNSFHQSLREDYLVGYFYPWFSALSGNVIYIATLAVIEYDVNASAFAPINQSLNADSSIIMTLLGQTNPEGAKVKSIALPSLTLCNSFVRAVTNKAILAELALPYLYLSRMVYQSASKKNDNYYQFFTFNETLTCVTHIFAGLHKTPLPKSLCQLMAQSSFWIFSGLILRTETFATRRHFYVIIGLAIEQLLDSRGLLEDYLSENILGLLGEGLQIDNEEIVRTSLNNFILIYMYCQEHQEETQQLQKWIEEYDIVTGLENLVHSQNQDIQQKAEQLLHLVRGLKGSQEQMEEQTV